MININTMLMQLPSSMSHLVICVAIDCRLGHSACTALESPSAKSQSMKVAIYKDTATC